ncbi:hypothetical protein A2U01_0064656, partial [Trifolium medium]|nr:hypothetical protein [Trifolium medium]
LDNDSVHLQIIIVSIFSGGRSTRDVIGTFNSSSSGIKGSKKNVKEDLDNTCSLLEKKREQLCSLEQEKASLLRQTFDLVPLEEIIIQKETCLSEAWIHQRDFYQRI